MKNIFKRFVNYWGKAQAKEGYVHRDAVVAFFQKEITDLLMSMPLEEETKDNDVIRGGGELNNYIRGSWMGFNTNIQVMKAWRDKILK